MWKTGSLPGRVSRLLPLFLLLAGCDETWMQFHGNGPSSGFVPIDVAPAVRTRWRARVGGVTYSSPVVGPDGTIYVGNTDGELVAVNPDGSERWRSAFPGTRILSSPAVAAAGEIYVVTSRKAEDGTVSSSLSRVEADGSRTWTTGFPEGGITTASPKLWSFEQRTHVLVQVLNKSAAELVIVQDDGAILHRHDVDICPPPGADLWPDFFEDIAGFLSDIWDVFSEIPSDFDPAALDIPTVFGWPDPTVAVLSRPGEDEAGVIVANGCGVSAWRWAPPVLTSVWIHEVSEERRRYSSPAVFEGGLLALAGEDRRVRGFDALTGELLWEQELAESILSSPASFGRQIWVASLNHLVMLDYNGDILDEIDLGESEETAASVALGANLGFLSTTSALHSFGFDFDPVISIRPLDGGLSSPAIGSDGTLYVVSGDELWAFPGP